MRCSSRPDFGQAVPRFVDYFDPAFVLGVECGLELEGKRSLFVFLLRGGTAELELALDARGARDIRVRDGEAVDDGSEFPPGVSFF